MTPPVVIVTCPIGDHLWADLNPRWVENYGKRSGHHHLTKYCPEHQTEKAARVKEAVQESQRRRSRAYDKMPLPVTRRCCNPEPHADDHRPGAVLPASEFYRRAYSVRQDGSRARTLDSRCKKCRRREVAARREVTDPKVIKLYHERHLAKKRQARRALAREGSKRLDAGPFSEWLKEYLAITGMQVQEISRACRFDVSKYQRKNPPKLIGLRQVDRVGAAFHPGLVEQLYPLDATSQDAA